MMPSVIYERLANDPTLNALGITPDRIVESQSVDSRPFENGYFVTINFQETNYAPVINRGPRATVCTVHRPWDIDRDYQPITKILNAIDAVLLPLQQVTGADGVRVTCVRPSIPARSGNQADEAWRTIKRAATYGVLYDESAA